MKNVASSKVDNLVLLSFSVASRMTDDIRRPSEGTEEGKEARKGQGRGEKEGRKRDGMFKRESMITGERSDGESERGRWSDRGGGEGGETQEEKAGGRGYRRSEK